MKKMKKVLAFSPKREYLIEVKNDGVLPVMGRTPSFVPGKTAEMPRNAASRGTEEIQYHRFGKPSQKPVVPRPSTAKSGTAADEEERLGMTQDSRAAEPAGMCFAGEAAAGRSRISERMEKL